MAATPKDPPIPEDIVRQDKYAIIGGSGVTVSGQERYSLATPFGHVVNISFLDAGKRVLFVNRHLSTSMDPNGAATYAPPHEVNFHALLYALKKLNVKGICAIGSVGTLRPGKVRSRFAFLSPSCHQRFPQTFSLRSGNHLIYPNTLPFLVIIYRSRRALIPEREWLVRIANRSPPTCSGSCGRHRHARRLHFRVADASHVLGQVRDGALRAFRATGRPHTLRARHRQRRRVGAVPQMGSTERQHSAGTETRRGRPGAGAGSWLHTRNRTRTRNRTHAHAHACTHAHALVVCVCVCSFPF